MQRARNNTVTDIPILIPCSRDERQGEATFDQFTGPVREVTGEDFSTKTGRHRKFLDSMREDERQHFAAVVRLLKAIERHDRTAANKARNKLSELREATAPHEQGESKEVGEELGRLLAPYWRMRPDQGKEALEIFEGRRWPPHIAHDEARVLSFEISRTLASGVDLVFWWTGERFTPALFCHNPKVAPYVYILTRKGWNVCPHCGTFFEQQRRDQDYCCIAHREAHRVARWRAAQRAKKPNPNRSKSKRKAGKHGTQKTR